MKNKRLTLILAILFVVVVMATLSSTMFMLASVKVNFLNSTFILTNCEQQILESANFEYGENVLLLSKRKYKHLLEINNPYLQVVNIETVFPNKLIINCVERVPLFALKQGERYLLLDKQFKVLQNCKEDDILGKIELCGIEFDDTEQGYLLNTNKEENTKLNCMINGLLMWNNEENFLNSKISKIFININNIQILTTDLKKINIENFTKNFEDKFNIAFSTYVSGIMTENTYINVYENNDGKIIAVVG